MTSARGFASSPRQCLDSYEEKSDKIEKRVKKIQTLQTVGYPVTALGALVATAISTPVSLVVLGVGATPIVVTSLVVHAQRRQYVDLFRAASFNQRFLPYIDRAFTYADEILNKPEGHSKEHLDDLRCKLDESQCYWNISMVYSHSADEYFKDFPNPNRDFNQPGIWDINGLYRRITNEKALKKLRLSKTDFSEVDLALFLDKAVKEGALCSATNGKPLPYKKFKHWIISNIRAR
ncbi:MAG: hypothetical protein HYV97_01205 [Bdellovibrio sp.]|nr:hypothetical protein [Bdellovibrio sp.]